MNLLLVLAGWSAAARTLAGLAVGQLWQGIAVSAGLALCLQIAPRTRAAHRFALWFAAFGLLVTLPVLPWVAGLAEARHVALSSVQAATVTAPAAWFRLDARWSLWIVVAWAALAAASLLRLAMGAVRARKIWKDAEPLAGSAAIPLFSAQNAQKDGASVNSVLEKLPGRDPVEICLTRHLERPAVIGYFRPRILIPDWLVGKLTAGELRQIVLHEMEHLRRYDDWTLLAQKICVALFPLNPALLWMDRRLGREREMACDEGVVRRTRAPRAYAACLANLAERRMETKLARQAEALALGIWRRRPELAERVASLLWAKQMLGPAGRAVLAGALGCGLLAATAALTHAPQLVAFVAEEPTPARMLAAALPAAPINAFAKQVAAKRHPAVTAARKAISAPARDELPREAVAMEHRTEALSVVARMTPEPEQTEGGQWVVLAVFEQKVESRMQGRSVVSADYEIDAASISQSDPAASSEPSKRNAEGLKTLWKSLPVVPIHETWVFFEL